MQRINLASTMGRMSIRVKLALIVAGGLFVSLAITFVVLTENIERIGKQNQIKNESLVASMLVSQMESPVRFKDSDRIEQIYLQATEVDQSLIWVSVEHTSGAELSVFGDLDVERPILTSMMASVAESGVGRNRTVGDYYMLVQPILSKDQRITIGTAAFVWDESIFLDAHQREVFRALGISAIVAFIGLLIIVAIISRMITRPLSMLTSAMQAVGQRHFDTEIPCTLRKDEVGIMAKTLANFRDTLAEEESARDLRAQEAELRQRLFQTLAARMSDLAKGQTNCKIDLGDFSDLDEDHLNICRNFNGFIGNLRSMLETILSTAESVRTSSREISDVAEEQSRRSETQAATLEESAAAIDDLNSSVQKTAGLAADANQRITENRALAKAGGEVVDKTVRAMKDIESSSQQITAIIGVIDDIAFQTNLLALNAGVEAARAGESGRGFAVVASEVRALAQRASDSANEIKELILRSSEHVTEGSELASSAGSALGDIIKGVTFLSDLAELIATGSRDQAINLAEIKESVNSLDAVTQQNAAVIQESAAASRSLHLEAERMTVALQQFTIDQPHQHSAAERVISGQGGWADEMEHSVPAQVSRIPRVSTRGGAAVATAVEGWEEF